MSRQSAEPRTRPVGPVAVAAGVVVSAGAAFLTNVVVARSLPVAAAGDFFVVASVATVAGLLLRAGLDKAVVRAVSLARADSDRSLVASLARGNVVLAAAIATVALPLVWLWAWPWLASGAYDSPALGALALPIAGWLVFEGVRTLVSEPLRGMGHQVRATVLGDAGRNLAFLGVVAVAALTGALTLAVAVTASAVVCALVVVTAAVVTVRASGPWPGATQVGAATGALTSMTGPFFLAALGSMAVAQGDIFVGGFTLPRENLAHYAAAAKLSLVVALPVSALNLLIAPWVAVMWHWGDRVRLERRVRRLALLFLLATAPLCLVFVLAGPVVMGLVYGAPYRAGGLALAILACGALVTLVTGPNGYVLLMTGEARYVGRVTVVVALLQVGSMVVAASTSGVVGLAAASTAGTVLLNALFALRLASRDIIRTDALLPVGQWLPLLRGRLDA